MWRAAGVISEKDRTLAGWPGQRRGVMVFALPGESTDTRHAAHNFFTQRCVLRKVTHMTSADIIKRLKAAGFTEVSVRGSHHKFRHENGRVVIVPHPKKDMPIGTARSIFKQAGIDWRSE
ncbi:type II toxin-antitoxin system HicA family toxin [Pandoraea sp. SD6-2]|uniref:type II toxin-antitoxin system HicA family toxin n=1 Tax=Pandoraea sp. SD6-2 TaxID=1286093 RepID=UPI0026C5187B